MGTAIKIKKVRKDSDGGKKKKSSSRDTLTQPIMKLHDKSPAEAAA